MNPEIQAKFATYPVAAKQQLESVRRLIFAVAEENHLGPVAESLKWGEASFVVKGGSPVRIEWKPKEPDVIKLYFHCQTRLVETFREVYRDEFAYEGKRAIVISLNAPIDEGSLGHCLELALKYHSLKHRPLLGA